MNLNDIMRALYFRKETYFIDIFGKVKHNQTTLYADRNNCHSAEQMEHWLSFNDLLNVSVYLNDGWQPDWSQPDKKYIVCLQKDRPEVKEVSEPCNLVYFKSEEAARQAIELLGEEKVATLLKGII